MKHFKFKSGEQHIVLENYDTDAKVYLKYTGDESFFKMLLKVDALRRRGLKHLELMIPYFPGSRQDRINVRGEPLTVKVYADIINLQQFDRVYIFDPHSDVTPALINNVFPIDNHGLVAIAINSYEWQNYALVSPDAGSNKKIYALSQFLDGPPVIRADKTRNTTTGEITGTEVYCSDLNGQTCVIVDDICSGGRTFMELAKKLKAKNSGEIILIVSHYEGVANLQHMKESGIDKIITTNSINDLEPNDYLEIHNIFKFI